jgi:hypothetical protein
VPHGQRDKYLLSYSRLSRPEPLLFRSSSSSVALTRLTGPRSRPTTSQKNLVAPGIEPGTLDLYPRTLTIIPQRRSALFYITYINSVRTSQETIHLRSAARNSDH